MSNEFTGFPQAGLQFLNDLAENNHREWFESHKQTFKSTIIEPAQAFILAMGRRLETIAPNIRYDTRTNGSGSMTRIYRDTRFSKDKTPYKTWIGIAFWEGEGKKNEKPGFYFGLSNEGSGIHVGMHGFPKPMLTAYRHAVVDEELGLTLVDIINLMRETGYAVEGSHYQRVPRGFDKDHPRADLLLHNTLYASPPAIAPEVVTSTALLDVCFHHFQQLAPLHRWLVQVDQSQSL